MNEASLKNNIQLNKAIAAARDYYDKMQSREKKILLAALAVLAAFTIANSYSMVEETFLAQEERMRKVVNEVDLTAAGLFRYQNLKNRLNTIENSYKEVQADANESYFERLLKTKAGVSNSKDFNIRPRAAKDFGGEYKQTSYLIKFTIVDPNRLTDFLKELAQGAKPVLISRISIKPRLARDALDVELEIASLKKTKAA